MDDSRESYSIGRDETSQEREAVRLGHLTRQRDPRTRSILGGLGVGPGWVCLEAGAGSGSISRWLADRVLPGGRVLSADIDLRFHCDPAPGLEVRHMDVRSDSLGTGTFDLVHARALLQHLPQREEVLDRFVDCLRPGGWLVIEDSDWAIFEAQTLPEPLAEVVRLIQEGGRARWNWDTSLARRLPGLFAQRGLVDIDVSGEVWTMRGGEDSGEWYFLAIEEAAGAMIENGLVTREEIDEALRIARSSGLVMVSPLSMTVVGRLPSATS